MNETVSNVEWYDNTVRTPHVLELEAKIATLETEVERLRDLLKEANLCIRRVLEWWGSNSLVSV